MSYEMNKAKQHNEKTLLEALKPSPLFFSFAAKCRKLKEKNTQDLIYLRNKILGS